MKTHRNVAALVLAAAFVIPAAARAEPFKIDAEHSTVGFSIRHLFSTVKGQFKTYDAIINYDAKSPEKSSVKATIDVKSIDTGTEKRDEHLRSKDFFDVEHYPSMTFESTKVKMTGKNKAKITGKLSMHGVTKDVVLEASFNGAGSDPWGNRKAGFSATTKLNRKDYGLTWNAPVEAGGVLVGDEVTINLDIEASSDAPVPAAEPAKK